jgi:hypothetical protein
MAAFVIMPRLFLITDRKRGVVRRLLYLTKCCSLVEDDKIDPMAVTSRFQKHGHFLAGDYAAWLPQGLTGVRLVAVMLLAGCSAPTPQNSSQIYEVAAPKTLFYHLDPRLVNEADGTLGLGTIVTIVGRQFGFSRVRLADGDVGFVPTRDLGPVAMPSMRGGRISGPAPRNSVRQAGRGDNPEAGTPTRLDMSDTPLPELPTGGQTPTPNPPFLIRPSLR